MCYTCCYLYTACDGIIEVYMMAEFTICTHAGHTLDTFMGRGWRTGRWRPGLRPEECGRKDTAASGRESIGKRIIARPAGMNLASESYCAVRIVEAKYEEERGSGGPMPYNICGV